MKGRVDKCLIVAIQVLLLAVNIQGDTYREGTSETGGHTAPTYYENKDVDGFQSFYNGSLHVTVSPTRLYETTSGMKVGRLKINIKGILDNMSYNIDQGAETMMAIEESKSFCNSIPGKKLKRPRNCEDIQIINGTNTTSGVYRIYPYPIGQDMYFQDGVEVFCDMDTDGGGWTVIQRRMDETDFERSWNDYRAGFGNLSGSHWLALDVVAQMTQHGEYSLRVYLQDWEGIQRTANYGYFKLGSITEKYKLYIYDYAGNAGDALISHHEGKMFSTKDQDNDAHGESCAQKYSGAWWYNACHTSNLNGRYLKGSHSSYANGVNWEPFRGQRYSLKRTEMKIRRRCLKRD